MSVFRWIVGNNCHHCVDSVGSVDSVDSVDSGGSVGLVLCLIWIFPSSPQRSRYRPLWTTLMPLLISTITLLVTQSPLMVSPPSCGLCKHPSAEKHITTLSGRPRHAQSSVSWSRTCQQSHLTDICAHRLSIRSPSPVHVFIHVRLS